MRFWNYYEFTNFYQIKVGKCKGNNVISRNNYLLLAALVVLLLLLLCLASFSSIIIWKIIIRKDANRINFRKWSKSRHKPYQTRRCYILRALHDLSFSVWHWLPHGCKPQISKQVIHCHTETFWSPQKSNNLFFVDCESNEFIWKLIPAVVAVPRPRTQNPFGSKGKTQNKHATKAAVFNGACIFGK